MRLFMLPLTGGGVSVDLVGIPLLDGNRSPDRSPHSHSHIGKSKITQDDSIWKYVCKDKIRRDIFVFLAGFLGGCAACSFFYRFSFMLV